MMDVTLLGIYSDKFLFSILYMKIYMKKDSEHLITLTVAWKYKQKDESQELPITPINLS